MKNIQKTVVGLTGNIGSGKSYIAEIFKKMGIPVFDSDKEAKVLLNTDEKIRKEIRKFFGEDVFTGKLPDRKKLAAIVFSDKKKLEELNSIIHPAVKKRFDAWVKEQGAPLVVREAAILIESGSVDNDAIVLVTAPEETRIGRVMKRDKVTRDDVRRRMNNQMPEEEKRKYADYIIINDGETPVLPQINEVLENLNKRLN